MDSATPYLHANKIVVIKLLNKFLLKGSINLSSSREEKDRLEGKRKYDEAKKKMQVIFNTNVMKRKGEGSEESEQEVN